MGLTVDTTRGSEVADVLTKAFKDKGIFGRTVMPEDLLPGGVDRGSVAHILFITLTVAIDYLRDAPALWNSSCDSFADPNTRFLFEPRLLHQSSTSAITAAMQKHRLSRKHNKDAHIWQTVGDTFHKKWAGDPANFLLNCGWDGPRILQRLRDDVHMRNGLPENDFPSLRGEKIGPLWLRMLRDNVGLSRLCNLDKVPIPVDVHVARATFATGVVRGTTQASLRKAFECVRTAWFGSVNGLSTIDASGAVRPMVALDVDEPLWHLSKYGCSARDTKTGHCANFARCDVKAYCVQGRVKMDGRTVGLEAI